MPDSLMVNHAGRAVVTDLGRPGVAQLGIPDNGAADQYSAAVANILVGNPQDAALIEVTASDLELITSRPTLMAVTGAPATVMVDGRPVPQWQPLCVDSAQRVTITGVHDGLRVYLGVHGTLDVPLFHGSCAPDSLLQIGTFLTAGTRLRFDSTYGPVRHPFGQPLFQVDARPLGTGTPWLVDVVEGPDIRDFPDAAKVLESSSYTVGSDSNHIGVRLDGPAPARTDHTEIRSRGVPIGAVEVPPTGELLVLQRGRPVTAGYPVVGVVTRCSNSLLGQVVPGHEVRLRYVDLATAVAAYRSRRQHLRQITRRVHAVFSSLGIPTNHPARRTHHEQPAH